MPPTQIPDDMQMNEAGTVLERRRGADNLLVYFAPGVFKAKRFDLIRTLAAHDADLIFIGDPNVRFYLKGVPGVADSYQGVADWLAERASRYRHTTFLGSSSGATASLMLGERAGIDLSLCFGPFVGVRRDDASVLMPIPSWIWVLDAIEDDIRADPTGRMDEASRFHEYLTGKAPGPTKHMIFTPQADISDRFNGWRLRDVANCHRFYIPNVLHPGISFAMRRGHLDDLLHIASHDDDPGAAALAYCRRYFTDPAAHPSRLGDYLRQLRRARRKRRFAAELKTASKRKKG